MNNITEPSQVTVFHKPSFFGYWFGSSAEELLYRQFWKGLMSITDYDDVVLGIGKRNQQIAFALINAWNNTTDQHEREMLVRAASYFITEQTFQAASVGHRFIFSHLHDVGVDANEFVWEK